MEASFIEVRKALTHQIWVLESQCQSIVSSLNDENNRLRRELVEAQCGHSLQEAIEGFLHSGEELPHSQKESVEGVPCFSEEKKLDTRKVSFSTAGIHLEPRSLQDFVPDGPLSEREPLVVPEPRAVPSAREALAVRSLSRDMKKDQKPHFEPRTLRDCGPDGPLSEQEPLAMRPSSRTVRKDQKAEELSTESYRWSGLMKNLDLGNDCNVLNLHHVQELSLDITQTGAVQRWALLFTGVIAPEECRKWMNIRANVQLSLWPHWLVKQDRGRQVEQTDTSADDKACGSSGHLRGGYLDHRGVHAGSVVAGSCPVTVHPDNKRSILHAFMQGAFIAFDVIDFPLSAFYSNETRFANIMLVVCGIFWTWDVCFGFLQGYHRADGLIELRLPHIARDYLRHWFIFDLSIVTLDWTSVIVLVLLDSRTKPSSILRATKIGKAQRILRAARLLRMAKLVEKLQHVLDAPIFAEQFVVVSRIFGLVGLILIINHYVACAWYGIAESSSSTETWIKEQKIEDSTIFVKYFYSLHWALTQFTPCTNNIAPANGTERFFASFVVLLALVVFSSFLSSLTSAIMQVRKLNSERNSEQSMIRDFLSAKKVPLTVSNRVWGFYRSHYHRKAKTVEESRIPFFAAMPKSLRRELRTYVYLPTLRNHPVINDLVMSPSDRTFGPVLCERLTTSTMVSGQDVFLEGEVATQMYFLLSGKCIYSFYGMDNSISESDYVTEAVLWLREWRQPGCLAIASNQCELIQIDPMGFHFSVQSEVSDRTYRMLRKYAALFAQAVEHWHSDQMLKDEILFGDKFASMRRSGEQTVGLEMESRTDLGIGRLVYEQMQSRDLAEVDTCVSRLSSVTRLATVTSAPSITSSTQVCMKAP